MKITDVQIDNLCQLETLRFTLVPGLNFVVGPNGSGKSNTMKMIYAALTNDFKRNEGDKLANIRQQSGDQDPAGVRVTFEHGGSTYTVHRDVRRGKQSLRLPDGSTLNKDAEINSRISQIVGVTPDIIDQYVFVDQWSIFSFLSATEATRAKAFQRLFGTIEAEKVWATVGETLAGITVPAVLVDIDAANAEVASLEYILTSRRAELSAYADLPDRMAAEDPDRQAVRDYHRRQELERVEEQSRIKVETLEAETLPLRKTRDHFLADRAVLVSARDGGQPEVEAARSAIANWKTVKIALQARSRLENQREKLQQEEVLHSPPRKPSTYVSDLDAEFIRRKEDLTGECLRLRNFIDSFDPATGVSSCPTCLTPVSNLAEPLACARERIKVADAELRRMQERLNQSVTFDRESTQYETWKANWSKSLKQTEDGLAQLQDVPRPVHDEATLSQIVSSHEELVAAVKEIDSEVSRIDRELASREGQLSVVRDAQERARIEREALRVVSSETIPEIEERIETRLNRFQQRATLRGYVESTERALTEAKRVVASAQSKRKEYEKLSAWVKHLGHVRGVFHRDALPRIVSQRYLQLLKADTNEFLSTFESPFRVEVEHDLSFRATYLDGRNQPAGRLSGGEKVTLAIAFRLAVNLTFASDVGLLCLDEPTAGLDDHNLGCLEVALQRLGELSRSRGLQVILVTHERGLHHLADKVIDLSAK